MESVEQELKAIELLDPKGIADYYSIKAQLDKTGKV